MQWQVLCAGFHQAPQKGARQKPLARAEQALAKRSQLHLRNPSVPLVRQLCQPKWSDERFKVPCTRGSGPRQSPLKVPLGWRGRIMHGESRPARTWCPRLLLARKLGSSPYALYISVFILFAEYTLNFNLRA